MAKNVKTTSRETRRECAAGKITSKTRVHETRAVDADTGGVVAYTKGSRFKDAEVLAVVKRVLGEGVGSGVTGR